MNENEACGLMKEAFHSTFNDYYSVDTRRILRILSENSRTSVTEIASSVGLSGKTVKSKILKLENALSINYSVELNSELHHMPAAHLVVIEFKQPVDYEYVSALLSKSYIPQLAFSVKGGNYICVYAMSISTSDFTYWENTISIMLSKFGGKLVNSEIVFTHLGFIPVRKELIEHMELEPTLKKVLGSLVGNSRASMQSISRETGLHFNTVAYSINKLISKKIVRRFTLTTMPPEGSAMFSVLITLAPKEGFDDAVHEVRKELKTDDDMPISNRYSFVSALEGNVNVSLLCTLDDNEDALRECVEKITRAYGKHLKLISFGRIDRVLVGNIPLRCVDSNEDYRVIDWKPDLDRLQK